MSEGKLSTTSFQSMDIMPALTIPPDKFDIYLRYKKGTREIIAWLLKYGSRKYKNVKSVTIRDLARISQAMCARNISMPETIHFLFRETISARSQLSRFFRDQLNPNLTDVDTVNHEFFTTSLSKIYNELCECCNQPPNKCKNALVSCNPHSHRSSVSNRYALLKEDSGRAQSAVHESIATCDECTQSESICKSEKKFPRLADDGLGDSFELSSELNELKQLLLATGSVWEQVNHDRTPLAVAAFTANAALSMFEDIESRIRTICGGADPEAIESRLSQLFGIGRAPANGELYTRYESQDIDLLEPWENLLQMKSDFHSDNLPLASPLVCDPMKLLVRSEGEGSEETKDNFNILLQSIGRYIAHTPHPGVVVRLGTPLFADIGYFLTHDETASHDLRCIYGLQIFRVTYTKYLLAAKMDGKITANCRLQALKFAQEALPSIEHILNDKSMPCRCYRTLAFHLEGLQRELKDFLEERNFDLFLQSPWVCGAHILEMLEATFYYGLRLLSYRNYVGSVLHAYNILRIFGGLERVPLLEELCNTFNDVIFPGGRPLRNFKACWIRFIGGRLRFNSHSSDHRSGNHHFVIPPYKAEATAGFGLRKEANDARFAYERISFFYHIKERRYHLDECLWDQVYGYESNGRRSCSLPRHQESARAGCDSQHRLLHLHSKALSEFSSGPLPAVKINFFAVYMHCVQIIAMITDEIHEKNGDRCTCFLETLVFAADGFQDQRRKSQPFGYKGLIEICNKAINQVLGGRDYKDFLWQTI